MKDDTEEVQEGIQSPGPAEEVQPASLDEALNSVLDEDQAQRVTVFVEKAPKFKPIKALSAEFSEALLTAASSAIVSMCESALQLMAVSPAKYAAWSSSIDMDLIFPVMLRVFNQQSMLLGK